MSSNSSAVSAAPAGQRLAFLDAARAAAALIVFFEHSLGAVLPGYRAWTATHFYPGRVGVLVFLMVSGFIIPVTLQQGGSNARFWVRRFFRLFPLYWLTIAAAFALAAAGVWPAFSPRIWLLNLTMLQGFCKCPDVVGVFWTLQLELVIYATCSILFAARLLDRPAWIAWLFLTIFAIAGLGRPLLSHRAFDVGGQRWLYFAPAVGLVAQRYWAGRMGRIALVGVVGGHALAVVAVWGVNELMCPGVIRARVLGESAVTWGLAYGCFFTLLAVRRWTIPSPVTWAGRISYSVYLLHPFMLVLAMPVTAVGWLALPICLAATLALSHLTYRFVEAPAVALGRTAERRWLPRAAPPEQPAGPMDLRRAA